MSSNPVSSATLRNMLRGLIAFILLVGAAFAQSGTGTITGRVFDEASGRSLQGAVVTVRGTNASDYTDSDGRFTIPAVRPGAVTLDVEYVGLDPAALQTTVA